MFTACFCPLKSQVFVGLNNENGLQYVQLTGAQRVSAVVALTLLCVQFPTLLQFIQRSSRRHLRKTEEHIRGKHHIEKDAVTPGRSVTGGLVDVV